MPTKRGKIPFFFSRVKIFWLQKKKKFSEKEQQKRGETQYNSFYYIQHNSKNYNIKNCGKLSPRKCKQKKIITFLLHSLCETLFGVVEKPRNKIITYIYYKEIYYQHSSNKLAQIIVYNKWKKPYIDICYLKNRVYSKVSYETDH